MFFSTLIFRISNQRGVYRQLFDIYFPHPLSHLHRICNFYPLDNFLTKGHNLPLRLWIPVTSPSNLPPAISARVGQARPAATAPPFFADNQAAAPPPGCCIPPGRSWPAAFCRAPSASRSPAPCP